MTDDAKPKRKYRRRQRVEPMAVYAVIVTVKTGRRTETIYGESVRPENGCLVVVSMDGPPPLIEKTRYIPLGSAEIEVCARQQPAMRWFTAPQSPGVSIGSTVQMPQYQAPPQGPQLTPGPLELLRQREAGMPVAPPRQPSQVVERNSDGVPVVTAGFLDGSPS